MLGLRFIGWFRAAPAAKIDAIAFYGGECYFVDARAVYDAAQSLAGDEAITSTSSPMPNARRIGAATTISPNRSSPRWRATASGAALDRLRRGTGTSATTGAMRAMNRFGTGVCVADPAGSVFHRHCRPRRARRYSAGCIEGIGRQRVEPSFLPISSTGWRSETPPTRRA